MRAIILACARSHGLSIKLHTEQFQRVGGLELGLKMGALSIDHLEVCSPEQCRNGRAHRRRSRRFFQG